MGGSMNKDVLKKLEDTLVAQGMSVLEARSVTPGTLQDYVKRASDFILWCNATVGPLLSMPTMASITAGAQLPLGEMLAFAVPDHLLELALLAYLDRAFFHGHPAAFGEKLLASIMFLAPRFAQPKGAAFPRAWRAIRGWKKVMPPVTRLPLPWLCLMAVFQKWLPHKWAETVAALLAFHCYLRPFELESLTPMHIASAFDPATQQYKVGLILAPIELGRPGKTGNWEEAVMVDRHPSLQAALRYLAAARPPHERLWPFPPGSLQALLAETAADLHMTELSVSLYSLRHGGASMDTLEKTRSFAEIKARGRWHADSSLRRYAKASKLVDVMGRLPQQVLANGNLLSQQLDHVLAAHAPLPSWPFFHGKQ